MNIWIGTDLAADILGSVKDTPGDKVAQVIVKNANEPWLNSDKELIYLSTVS